MHENYWKFHILLKIPDLATQFFFQLQTFEVEKYFVCVWFQPQFSNPKKTQEYSGWWFLPNSYQNLKPANLYLIENYNFWTSETTN